MKFKKKLFKIWIFLEKISIAGHSFCAPAIKQPSASHRYAERLNTSVQVHVKESILIMPNAWRWIGYFVAHKPVPIVSGIGQD
jgi:hypothetical protein